MSTSGVRRFVAALVAVAAVACAGLLTMPATSLAVTDGTPRAPSVHQTAQGLPAAMHQVRRTTTDPVDGHPLALRADSGSVDADVAAGPLPGRLADRPEQSAALARASDRAPPTWA